MPFARVIQSLVIVGLGTWMAGCIPAGSSRTTVERIGGQVRVRRFASPTAYEAFLRAELALARGDVTTASRQLELAEIADPGDSYLAARRAEVLWLAGEHQQALDIARAATRRFPHDAAPWLALGEILTERGQIAEATAAFTHALAAAPDDPEVRSAVARAQGAAPIVAARAMETAPGTRPADRTLARRMTLNALEEARPVLRTLRRIRARQAWTRRDYRAVDDILSPIVLADPTDVVDRVTVIQARALDGRPGDAARLVPGVPVGTGTGGVSLAEHARLWLMAGRPDLAAEEAERAWRNDPTDVLARRVLGEALVRTRQVARGLELLAAIPAQSSHFVDARLAAAHGLCLAGRPDLADQVLERAVSQVNSEDAIARDRLRLARAELMLRRGMAAEARAILVAIESPIGRQRRGAMLAHIEAPNVVLADLRVRSGDRTEDALADAWIALVCWQHTGACTPEERERALRSARERVESAPETLRALALATADRRRALELLRLAAARDPLSPWNSVVSRQLGAMGDGSRSAGTSTLGSGSERRERMRTTN